MPAFQFRARDESGQLITGKQEADTERDVVVMLRTRGFTVLGVERDRELQSLLKQQSGLFQPRIKHGDLAVFARQFATMTNAGLPVVTALKVLARQTSSPRLGEQLERIATDVEGGESLQTAFARTKQFPTIMVQMIGAGEVGGILEDVMRRVATQMEKDELIRQKVRSAMVYPTIVSCIAVLVVIFMMIFVVPRFVEVYADMGADLPWTTQMLIGTSGTVAQYWWLVLGGAAALFFGLRAWIRTEQGGLSWDKLMLKMPVFGDMLLKQCVARFCRTLGGLLSSGVSILRALSVVKETAGNRVVAAAVQSALESVRGGSPLVNSLQKAAIFPPMVQEMVSVGEETGTMEEMLHKVADFYEEEVQRTAERLSSSLEPFIIVGLALTVGFIVASMMMPIFNLWGTIG